MEIYDDVDFYLAGGAVRDSVRNDLYEPTDFDFFVRGKRLERLFRFLAKHGDLTAGPFGAQRWSPQNGGTRYADVVVIENFRNGLWHCEDIIDVLNQFDFTANAIGVDLRSRGVFDPQNGLRDLRAGVMRAVRFDYPDEPISADCPLSRLSVLWIRIVHYARTLGLSIEPVTRQWLRSQVNRVHDIPAFSQVFFSPDTTGFLP